MKFWKRDKKPKRDKGVGMDKTIKVKWIKSANGRPGYQMKTIRGLGFKRLYQTRLLPDQPAIRGMVKRVNHLLEIVESAEGEQG